MTQLNNIKALLEMNGKVSRNYCLRNYISRLGARIDDLKHQGWVFRTEREGGDYVYYLESKPTPTRYKMHDMVEQKSMFSKSGYRE